MSIWIHEESKVLIQGITGKQGTFHGTKMDEYNTCLLYTSPSPRD